MQRLATDREISRYSIAKLIRDVSPVRTNPSAPSGIEADLSRAYGAAYDNLNYGSDGAHVPAEVLTRTLTAGNFASAGALGQEKHDDVFTKYLFPQSIVLGLGANFLGGLDDARANGSGAVAIPAVTAAQEGQWLAEGQAANDQSSGVSVALKMATPKRVTTTIVVGNQLLAQVGPQADAALWKVLMAGVAAAIDRAALAGTAGAQPLGVLNMPGTTVVSLGADGGALSLPKLCEVEAGPVDGNVALSAGGYALSPNTREKAKTIQKWTGASVGLVETREGRDYCNGYRAFPTPLLPDTLTAGGGTSLGSIVFGADWTVLHVVSWGGMQVVSDPYTQALANRTVLHVTLFADVVTPHQAAFAVCRDVLNT